MRSLPKRFLARGGAFCVALAALLAAGPGCGGRTGPPRGLVLVVVDTLRADHLGVYGYSRPTSPSLDALAGDAVLFRDVASPAPWTLPSLATLMTSLYPSVHGAHSPSNLQDLDWYFRPKQYRAFSKLHPSRVTLAEVLRDAGFATYGAVQGSYPTSVFGMSQGFGTYRENATPGLRFDLEDALAWLDATKPDRFFVYLHVQEVHAPYTPVAIRRGAKRKLDPARMSYYREAVAEERARFLQHDFDPGYGGPIDGSRASLRALSRPGTRVSRRDVEHLVALYDRGIAYVDYWIGALVRGLADRRLLDDTLLVVTADHGEEFLEHGRLEHSFSYYEEMLHVPLVIRVPGEGRGRVVEQTVGLVDVMPTLLDVLGVEAPPGLEGRSLRALWRHGGAAPSAESAYVGEASFHRGDLALRGPGWKYIQGAAAPGQPPRQELYDLVTDPGEKRNRCPDEPTLCRSREEQLRARMASLRARAEALAAPEPATLDGDTRESLRALGYLDGSDEPDPPEAAAPPRSQ